MSGATRYRELLGLGGGKLTGSMVHRALSGAKKATRTLAALAGKNWNTKKEKQ